MAFGSKRKPKTVEEPEDVERGDAEEFDGQINNASELIGRDSSALSLDGRSLIVPNYGDIDDMSSLGTSKYNYRGDGQNNVEYIGNMKIVGRTDNNKKDRSSKSPIEQKFSRMENDSALQYGDYDEHARGTSLERETKGKENTSSQSLEEMKYAEKSGCLPQWIEEAPTWLKLIIIASIALILGALVLIVVGAKLSTSSSSLVERPSSTSSPVSDATVSLGEPEVMTTSNPTNIPSASPIKDVPVPANPSSRAPIADVPTNSPSQAPSTLPPTIVPSNSPTQSPNLSTVNFYVIGGRFDGEDATSLVTGLQSLPNMDGNTVLVHLGDFNSPYSTSCVENSFVDNVELYQQSSVPVYFVPGDNEYNDCPNPTQALGFWKQYLMDFETKYWSEPSWDILRQTPTYSENFAFLQSEVLFVGINLVGGIVHNRQEWNARHAADIQWINTTATNFDGSYTTMVVLAHADPNIEINEYFFRAFYSMVDSYDEQVIFVHRNLGVDTWNSQTGYAGIPNLDVVAVEGSMWPPMWMQIDPINRTYTIDQSSWHNKYINTGTSAPAP
uniref:Calcineurin-like phosphoesterase domain-containing protein n=1 Tax=Pseudo-nitzschia australis TaxID=44445 RepID=A0A7S4ABC2_9STRA|mmetsp:Transcript_13149/g.26371  ORF Transcript_13149/g.26371 Transcript_13149/m.26371 type:complete len:557 (+) Transcript_13149:41-1711(+)